MKEDGKKRKGKLLFHLSQIGFKMCFKAFKHLSLECFSFPEKLLCQRFFLILSLLIFLFLHVIYNADITVRSYLSCLFCLLLDSVPVVNYELMF